MTLTGFSGIFGEGARGSGQWKAVVDAVGNYRRVSIADAVRFLHVLFFRDCRLFAVR